MGDAPMVVYVCAEGHVNGPHWAENGCEQCYAATRAVEVMPVDEHRGALDAQQEEYGGEISVRQGELDDIARLVGAPLDAPYRVVHDKVAAAVNAADQLRLA